MIHKRTSIREAFAALLIARLPGVPIEVNRAHRVSSYPHINIVSGAEVIDIENYASGSAPSEYTVNVTISVASNDHDTDLDRYLLDVERVVKDNRKSDDIWSFCVISDVTEPQRVPGNFTYSEMTAKIIFQYEDDS